MRNTPSNQMLTKSSAVDRARRSNRDRLGDGRPVVFPIEHHDYWKTELPSRELPTDFATSAPQQISGHFGWYLCIVMHVRTCALHRLERMKITTKLKTKTVRVRKARILCMRVVPKIGVVAHHST
jgi:hypothetical protein